MKKQKTDDTQQHIKTLLSAADVAELLGISRQHLSHLPIPQIRLSERIVRYDPNDVRSYLAGLRDDKHTHIT
jgi:hypothetical protein